VYRLPYLKQNNNKQQTTNITMCKLFIATGSFTKLQTTKLIDKAASLFSKTQRDGFGFTVYGSNGTVATGHYLEPSNYPGFNVTLPEWIDCNRIETGSITTNTTAIVCHGRTATSRVMLANVHPFISKGISLSHNGVLSWIGKWKAPKATNHCDSEQFLNWYNTLKAPFDNTKENWSGYGVFGIIDTKRKTLTVAKCGSGKLSYCSNNSGAHMWSTEQHDLESIAKVLSDNSTKPLAMRPNTICRFAIKAKNPRLLSVDNWQGFGSGRKSADWFKSMGPTEGKPTRYDRNLCPIQTAEYFPDYQPTDKPATATATESL
jgi:predicted glutamine amidotransferase